MCFGLQSVVVLVTRFCLYNKIHPLTQEWWDGTVLFSD